LLNKILSKLNPRQKIRTRDSALPSPLRSHFEGSQIMKSMSPFWIAPVLALALQSFAAHASLVMTASSNLQIFSSPGGTPFQFDGTDVSPATIIPGASGAGSGLNVSFSDATASYGAAVSVVQDFGVFHGLVTVSASQLNPSGGFRGYSAAGAGTFVETLTIFAPAGVANGSIGKLIPGWDISGSLQACCDTPSGESARAALFISAQTSAPLPNSSSVIGQFTGNGHYDLVDAIPFFFGTPFQLTVNSIVRADIGYDFRTAIATSSYNGVASASFLNTAALTTAAVLDAAGTPLTGVSITTSSGRPFPVAPEVPLPATLWLFSTAIGALSFVHRRPRPAATQQQ
jgi:hypothetical protein